MAFNAQQTMTKRWATTTPMDLGDVIGIDLGTTNSCVCVMVRCTSNDKNVLYFRMQIVDIFCQNLTRYIPLDLQLPAPDCCCKQCIGRTKSSCN
jgi:hypothetical protein